MSSGVKTSSIFHNGDIMLPIRGLPVSGDDVSDMHQQSNLQLDDVATIETVNEKETFGNNSKKKLTIAVDNDVALYDKIDTLKDTSHSPTDNYATSPMSPTSIYTVGGSDKRPKLELKAKEVSTRQCKFEIGEEWEEFQIIHDKAVSCPPSPLIGRKHDDVGSGVGKINQGYAASEPGAEIDYDLTESTDKAKEPFPFHFLFTSSSSSTAPLKKCDIVPNPYNRINQRFHSTLQCPCFLFFFFLCCLPAVHTMQQSDRQFKLGNNKRSRNYGKMATFFYVIGSVIGVAFLAVAIYFAADYVKQFV